MLQVRVIVSIKPHECSPLHPSLLLSTHLNPPQPHRDPDAKPTLPHPLQKAQPTSHQLTPTPLPLSLNPPLLLHLCLHWFHLSHSLREDSKKLLATTSHSLWLTAIPTLLVAWHWHRLTTVLGEPPQQKYVSPSLPFPTAQLPPMAITTPLTAYTLPPTPTNHLKDGYG